jgi:hypothetical protein
MDSPVKGAQRLVWVCVCAGYNKAFVLLCISSMGMCVYGLQQGVCPPVYTISSMGMCVYGLQQGVCPPVYI